MSNEPTLEQDAPKDMNINPTGKGGFKDHPEHINYGGRPKNAQSFAFWYGEFKNMTVKQLEEWVKNNPPSVRTVAADLAYRRVANSQKDLKEFTEVANRSEGMPKQVSEIEHKGLVNIALVEFLEPDADSKDTSKDTSPVS